MFWFSRKKRIIEQCEKLEEALNALPKPLLSVSQQRQVKKNLMNSLRSGQEYLPLGFKNLAGSLRSLLKPVLPDYTKFFLREQILEALHLPPLFQSIHPSTIFRSRFIKGALSSFLLLTFALVSVLTMPFQPHITYAQTTYVSEVRGKVRILRGSEAFPGKNFFDLREGDVIVTDEESFATIHFFDDSVSRLDENTSIQIQRLQKDPFNPLSRNIELFMKKGRLWSSIISLRDEKSHFLVQTKKGQAAANANAKATFDVKVKDPEGTTEVAVFDNSVSVSSYNQSGKEQEKTVVAGYMAETGVDNIITLTSLSQTSEVSHDSNEWIVFNKDRDTLYSRQLLESKELQFSLPENKGMEVSSSFASMVVGDDELAALQKEFKEAYSELKEGETSIIRGLHSSGVASINRFTKDTENILMKLSSFEKKKKEVDTSLFRAFMEERSTSELKDLSLFVPGDKLYVAKQAVEQFHIALQKDYTTKVKFRLAFLEGRILEIQELLKRGNVSLALTMLRSYQHELEHVTIATKDANQSELQAIFAVLVRQQIAHITVLTALESTLSQQPNEKTDSLLFEVKRLRAVSLRQLSVSLNESSVLLPPEIVNDLKNLLESYPVEINSEEAALTYALRQLLMKQYQLSFDTTPNPIELPDKVGMVTILSEGEGTPDPNL